MRYFGAIGVVFAVFCGCSNESGALPRNELDDVVTFIKQHTTNKLTGVIRGPKKTVIVYTDPLLTRFAVVEMNGRL